METTGTREHQQILPPDFGLESDAAAPLQTTTQPQPDRRESRRAEIVRPIDEPRQGKSLDVGRVIVRHSDDIAQLIGALALAQGKFKSLDRTREAAIKSQRAEYSYDYETLADVIDATKDALSENGLAVLQFPFPMSAGNHTVLQLRTMLAHSSGQWIYNDLTATIDGTAPREVGSGITYLCRYSRKAILGLAAQYDDDAEAASGDRSLPQAGQRRSEQARPKSPTGVITDVDAKGQVGVWYITNDSGYIVGTKDESQRDAAKAFMERRERVELIAQPPSDPKFTPKLIEIAVVRSE